ncbi:hypothetical protein [Cellulomonas sp. URHD0024]|uniref:hypothetical protein n=1 Tax=Cellulomonas sp. URHD0024 TaxID=1302620 RepID=UPI0004120AE3|nr:hypothetical protein [Cellulomonas sp. URHD0024]
MDDDTATRQAVLDLASIVLAQEAPEELAVLDETSRHYFDHPEAATTRPDVDRPDVDRPDVDTSVALALLAPVALAIAKPVIDYLTKLAGEALRDAVAPRVQQWVNRVLKKKDAPAEAAKGDPPAALTAEQAREVRRIAYERALALGVKDPRAGVLADAVAGGVVVAS